MIAGWVYKPVNNLADLYTLQLYDFNSVLFH